MNTKIQIRIYISPKYHINHKTHIYGWLFHFYLCFKEIDRYRFEKKPNPIYSNLQY